jgi:asparagine N-glycosylation enzyme membrane subunit Stt3
MGPKVFDRDVVAIASLVFGVLALICVFIFANTEKCDKTVVTLAITFGIVAVAIASQRDEKVTWDGRATYFY